MADENNQAVESSPATIEVPQNRVDYDAWRRTGKLPEAKPAESAKPKHEASASSHDEQSAADGAENNAPGSEPGENAQERPKRRSNADTRLQEILSDLKRAGLTPAELKTYKREAQAAAAAAGGEQPAERAQPAKPPAAGPQLPVKPKMDDFDSIVEYDEARDKYYEELSAYNVQKAIVEDRMRTAQEATARELKGKVAEAAKRYGDDTAESTIGDTAKTLFNDAEIPQAIKAVLNESDVLVDLLYTVGSKPEELESFVELSRTNPGAAIRRIILLEKLVSDELAKGGASGATGETQRDASGKFIPPAKKQTSAPPPPRELSGRGGTPPDEVESAAKASDFTAFRNASNRRDMARRKGQ